MSPTRREVLAQLTAVAVLPLRDWVRTDQDPLDGTIADYQAGRRRGEQTTALVTSRRSTAVAPRRSSSACWVCCGRRSGS